MDYKSATPILFVFFKIFIFLFIIQPRNKKLNTIITMNIIFILNSIRIEKKKKIIFLYCWVYFCIHVFKNPLKWVIPKHELGPCADWNMVMLLLGPGPVFLSPIWFSPTQLTTILVSVEWFQRIWCYVMQIAILYKIKIFMWRIM